MSINKSLATALLIVVLCVATTVTFVAAQDDDNEVPDIEFEPVVGEEAENLPDLPDIPMEELDSMDHADLVTLCKSLKSTYLPLIKHKFDHAHEAHIMSDAAALGKALDDAHHKHLKKDHNHFSCAEAKEMLDHSSAKKFVETYTKFATKASEDNLTNDQFIAKMRSLRTELQHSHLVNHESLATVDDAIEDLVHLGNWYNPLKQSYDHVVAKDTHCEKDYTDFLKELHDISTDKMPDWEHIHLGISSLVTQCEEDDSIRSEL